MTIDQPHRHRLALTRRQSAQGVTRREGEAVELPRSTLLIDSGKGTTLSG